MTTIELQEEFSLRIDKVGTAGRTGFLPDEVNKFFNDAQLQWVATRYSGSNPRGEALDETQLRIDNLRTLYIKHVYELLPADYDASSNSFPLSESQVTDGDYFHSLSQSIKAENLKCSGTVFHKTAFIAKNDEIGFIMEDPYARPNLSRPVLIFGPPFLELYIGNPDLVSNYKVFFLHRYLRVPNKIDFLTGVSSELPEPVHTELVDLSVYKALLYIGSPESDRFFQNITFRE